MAGKVAAGQIGQSHRDHPRKLAPECLLRLERSHDRRLGVQGVEDRLDEDEIDTTLDQRIDLLAIDRLDLVEVDLAVAGIVDVGRQGQGLVGGAQRTRHPARPAVFRRIFVSDAAHDLGRGVIDPPDERFGAVIGLADGIGVEGIGGEDLGAGTREALANRADDFGPGDVEQIVVAALVLHEVERAAIIGRLQLLVLN